MVRPGAPHRYSTPRGSAAGSSPFHEQPQARTAPLAARGRGDRSHVPPRSPDQARATFMPDTAWPVGRLPPGSSRDGFLPWFRCHLMTVDTSSVDRLRSPPWPTPDALTARLFPQRSPPRLLTAAACGGLRPPPARRPRRARQPNGPAPPSPGKSPEPRRAGEAGAIELREGRLRAEAPAVAGPRLEMAARCPRWKRPNLPAQGHV